MNLDAGRPDSSIQRRLEAASVAVTRLKIPVRVDVEERRTEGAPLHTQVQNADKAEENKGGRHLGLPLAKLRGLKLSRRESVGLIGGLNMLDRAGLSGISLASLNGGSCNCIPLCLHLYHSWPGSNSQYQFLSVRCINMRVVNEDPFSTNAG